MGGMRPKTPSCTALHAVRLPSENPICDGPAGLSASGLFSNGNFLAMSDGASHHRGVVYFVGAGPGDPGLLTLAGAERLGRADLVLYDYLVNQAVLGWIRPGTRLVCLGRHGAPGRGVEQAEVHARMIEAARQGHCVVRLKGGDPSVFGRLAEETEALATAGVAYEVVPGVTAGLGAAAYAAIPLTRGQTSSAVALVTGQERPDKAQPSLDYEALAHFPGTLVLYMGVTSAKRWSHALIQGGRPPATPVAIVRRATWSDQETVLCTLADVAHVVADRKIRPPAICLIGEVVAAAASEPWFASRPLVNTRILVTRPRHQSARLVQQLSDLGAEVLVQPAIEISPPADWGAVDAAIDELERFHWLVFSSSNGVQFLLDRLCARADLRRLGRCRLAAIGPGTAEALAEYHLRADLVPQEYRAEALAAALAGDACGKRFLLARASRGREVLAEELTAVGAEVHQVVVYQSSDVPAAAPEVTAALAAGRIDWVMVSSSAIARSLVALFGQDLRRTRLASISPVTSETLRALGFSPAAEAEQYTMDGMVRAICTKKMPSSGGGARSR